MKRLAAAIILALLTGCAGQQDAVVAADAALAAGLWPERLASGAVCRVGPDGGPLLVERGIGGTGAPVATQAARKLAERGIGGTGIGGKGLGGSGIVGFITGFASICVDGLEVHYDASAKVDIDGTASSIAALRVGQVVAIQAQGPLGAPSAGTIAVRREVTGRIDSIELGSGALTIAGQAVAVPATIWGAKRVRLGDWVAVSGMRRTDGMIVASRLDSAPAGTFMARGQIVRDGFSVRVGNLALHGPAAAGLVGGQFVTVTGGYVAGQGQANAVTSDTLWQNPSEFFGASVKHLVMQGFVQVTSGTVWLNGLRATIAPGVKARTGSDGVAIVSLERKPDGTYTAVGLRYSDYRGPPAKAARATGGAVPGGLPPALGSRTGGSPQAYDAGTGAPTEVQSRPGGTTDSDNLDVPASQLVPGLAPTSEPGPPVAMSSTSEPAVTTLAVTSGSPSLDPPAPTLEMNLAPEIKLVPTPLITSIQAPTESAAWRSPARADISPTVLPPLVQPSAPPAGDGFRIESTPPAPTNTTGSSTSQMISGTIPLAGPATFASAKPPRAVGAAFRAANTARSVMANASATSSTITLVTGSIVPKPAGGGGMVRAVPRASSSAVSTTANGRKTTATSAGAAPGIAEP